MRTTGRSTKEAGTSRDLTLQRSFYDKGRTAEPESPAGTAGRDCRGDEREVECDGELYRLIALDAKGIPDSRTAAGCAANLLSEAAKAEADTEPNVKVADTARPKVASRAKAHARPVVVAH